MKKPIFYFMLFSILSFLAACTSTGSEPAAVESADVETAVTNSSGSSMSMGRGGGMMARHHAVIPADYAGLTNPITADEASIERGGEIYSTHCATCHGDGGMGDGPGGETLDPVPAAIAHTSQMLGDDYLFWRVSESGTMAPFNSGMIAWKGILDEQARWDVINYVQALGSGAVMPGQHMGGAAFDPAVEAENQAQMLADGVAQGIITEEEAAVFAEIHGTVDDQMMQMRAEGAGGGMDEMMADILAALVASGDLTQEQADTFLSVHDRLGEAGLMQ
ncbi:MAG: c-type cytochrome [Anaerolineales bacterium]|nr:c-type cytochrome [Anaerolineales bacterium]